MLAWAFQGGSAVERNQSSREPTCGSHADLLAEDRAHSQFKAIPASRCTQARTQRHPGSKVWVVRQVRVNRLDISTNIE
jgi:hypothetical protein